MLSPTLAHDSTNRGLCGTHTPGCYEELTPHAFHARRGELGVVVLKAPEAAEEFAGFRRVLQLDCSAEIESALADWPRALPIGLVCRDGTCTSRLAIRLSRQGYQVVHLLGGLREWRQCVLR